jgi:DNA-binding winged helix-turn-helix (wHTH) protein
MEELGKNYESVAKFKRVYRFREFQLLEDGPILLASGQRVRATPKALQVLWTLVEANAQLVSKEELASAVWGSGRTDDNNIARHVAMLRAAIGDGLIETVPRLGYRFCGAATCETWPSANVEVPLLTELTTKADQESRASSSSEGRNGSLPDVAFRTMTSSRPASLCWIYAIYGKRTANPGPRT